MASGQDLEPIRPALREFLTAKMPLLIQLGEKEAGRVAGNALRNAIAVLQHAGENIEIGENLERRFFEELIPSLLFTIEAQYLIGDQLQQREERENNYLDGVRFLTCVYSGRHASAAQAIIAKLQS